MSELGVNLRGYIPGLWKRLQGQGVGAVLARGASGSFGIMMLGAALAFGINILLARLLGVTQYGIYIYVLTWVNLLSLICKLGLDTSLLRFIPAYNAKCEWGLLRGILSFSVRYVLLGSFVIALIAALVVWSMGEHIGIEQAKTFWIGLVLLPLLGLTSLRSAALRAFKRVVKAALPDSIFQRILIAILASITYLFSQHELLATEVMFVNILGALFAFYIGTVWLLKALPEQLRDTQPIFASSEWLKVALPLYLMSGMALILNKTGIILVGFYMNTEQAGIYAVSARIAGLIIFGLGAANTIVAPMISELYSTGKYRQLQKMITFAARGIFIFTFFVCVTLVLLGKSILSLFGEEFVVAYIPLLILVGGQSVNALAGSVGLLMTMTGHHKQAAWIIGFSALLNLILNFILIPMLGIIGAAIASAVTTTLWNFIMLYYVWNRMNFNPTIFVFSKT